MTIFYYTRTYISKVWVVLNVSALFCSYAIWYCPRTILVKTFGTLSVLGEENVLQVDPPPPLNSVGCYKSNTFYISCTLYGPQLCLGGVGEKSC